MLESIHLRWDWTTAAFCVLAAGSFLLVRNRARWHVYVRLLVFLLLFWMVLEPTSAQFSQSSGKPVLAVLMDTSKSMSIEDPLQRLSQAQASLRKINSGLENYFDVSYYEFAQQCSRTNLKDLMNAQASVEGTDLFGALAQVWKENREPPPNILLFSDGIQTFENPSPILSSPVFAVGLGQKGAIKDIQVKDLRGSDFAFKNRPIEFHVSVQHSGMKRQKVPVILQERKNNEYLNVEERTLSLDDSQGEQDVTFRYIPQAPGHEELRIYVPVQEGEIAKNNNFINFSLDVGREKIRVLYLCGQPSPEYAFLRQLLKSDPAVELVSFVILRNPENVVPVPEEQLSLIPFPANDIFVRTLSEFDLLIFENFSYSRFGILPSHLDNIEQFVERKGGGFLMMGGENSFSQGGYAGTAIERILPVNLNSAQEEVVHDEVSLKVLEPQHPLFDTGESLEKTEKLWQGMPLLNGFQRLGGIKKGASLLAAANPSGSPLVVGWQRKKGRVLAMGTLSTWQWALGLSEKGFLQSPYTQFWRQTVRWLTTSQDDRSVRIVLSDPQFSVGKKSTVRVMIRPELLPHGEASEMSLKVLAGEKEIDRLTLISESRTLTRAEWTPAQEGNYQLEANFRVGSQKMTDRKSIEVHSANLELENPEPRPDTLKALAEKSGGQFIEIADLNVDVLRNKVKMTQASKSDNVKTELWTHPYLFSLLILMLLAEWGLRRYRGEI